MLISSIQQKIKVQKALIFSSYVCLRDRILENNSFFSSLTVVPTCVEGAIHSSHTHTNINSEQDDPKHRVTAQGRSSEQRA